MSEKSLLALMAAIIYREGKMVEADAVRTALALLAQLNQLAATKAIESTTSESWDS